MPTFYIPYAAYYRPFQIHPKIQKNSLSLVLKQLAMWAIENLLQCLLLESEILYSPK